jgi:hypothetical protein
MSDAEQMVRRLAVVAAELERLARMESPGDGVLDSGGVESMTGLSPAQIRERRTDLMEIKVETLDALGHQAEADAAAAILADLHGEVA